ncbi:nodulation efficiency protein D (NfeD) [uncultured Bacteroides sp.]|uniref:nodulation efficiency protein D (NfeD) n=1 Tax=uncultured Bacteroides sp. TaxID=162156 RepID=UPI002AAA78A1|nr:nodulation efficiency protein D (NfeD) [uncultured Bacteroides sp.]
MDILIIIRLIVAGVILFLIEIFVIPGISFAGIGAFCCLIYANYFAFSNLGNTAGFITLATSAIACISTLTLFMKSKTLDKIALKKNINSTVDNEAEQSVKVGDTGIASTRLALIGMADINGHHVEVKSIDGLIEEKTPIIVSRIANGAILVVKQKQTTI